MEKEVLMNGKLVYGLEDKPSFLVALLLAFQHVFSMFGGTVIVPLIVGSHFGLDSLEQTKFIQIVLFAMGIATVMQASFGSKLPIVQGSSFAFLPAMLSAGSLASISGALIVGGLMEALFGFFGFVKKLLRFFTPAVSGVTVILIGLSLELTTIINLFSFEFIEIIVALMTLTLVGVLIFFGRGFMKLFPIIIGILFGLFVSSILGYTDFDAVYMSDWLLVFVPFAFGAPSFETHVIIAVVFAFFVSIIESVGDYSAVANYSKVKLSDKKVSRGIGFEGFSCIISGIFGGIATTSYSENVGVVGATKVASRYVVILGGVILIILSFVPKFSAILTAIPSFVLIGASIALFAMIVQAGYKMTLKSKMGKNNLMLVVSVSVLLGLLVSYLPDTLFYGIPTALALIIKSSPTIGAISAILIENFFVNKNK